LSINFDNRLILNLKKSRLVSGALAALHVGAAVIAATVPLPWGLRSILLGLIVASLYRSLMHYALHKGEKTVSWAQLEGDGEWRLVLGNGKALGPCSLKGYYAKPWLIIVRLAYPGKRLPLSLVVAPDAIDPDTFKNLRVRLNLESTAT
jgi:hypothetical protein